jgi:hypothetical protein
LGENSPNLVALTIGQVSNFERPTKKREEEEKQRIRVARCYIFKLNIQILGLAVEDVGIFYRHLVYFTAIWYTLWTFGMFFPVLVCCTKKNLASLQQLKPEIYVTM